jgi:uncharacterized protein YbjT (DUF2867 family)
MRYFILGGTGFIGGHLVAHLKDKGHKVTALVRSNKKNFPRSWTMWTLSRAIL